MFEFITNKILIIKLNKKYHKFGMLFMASQGTESKFVISRVINLYQPSTKTYSKLTLEEKKEGEDQQIWNIDKR